jgi:hypothetical protein
MLEEQLRALVNHWRALAAEAKEQGEETNQPALLRGHAFGVCDGLGIAAGDLEKLLEIEGDEEEV